MRKLTPLTSLLGIVALGSCSAVQPKPQCKAQPAEYSARYFMQGTPAGMCEGKVLKGEVLHLQYYRSKLDDPNGTPSLAIEPASVLDALDGDKEHTGVEFSQGRYTAVEPDDNDQCLAPKLSDTSITAGDTKLTYTWSNVRMIVTPLHNASVFGADLVRKDGDCTVTYKVSAVYPAVFCGTATKVVTGDDGKPVIDEMTMMPKIEPDPEHGVPDPMLCGAIEGNQISPDMVLECDASSDGMMGTHLCLPKTEFPSLKK
jgi:hypothetical protein